MVKIEHEVTIARTPSDVFAYLTDVEKLPEWQATALEGRLESDRMEQGARAVEVRQVLGQRMESTLEVTEYEPDRRFDAQIVSGPVTFRISHELMPENGGTRLRFVLEGEPGAVFEDQDIERQVRRQVKDDFRTLKIVLETAPPE
jgi:uncharacterized protein YndB with AHSA1/START domain